MNKTWREILDWYESHGYDLAASSLEKRLQGFRRPGEVQVDIYDCWKNNPEGLLKLLNRGFQKAA